MKISRNDPFDLKLSMRGLVLQMNYILLDFYEFAYHFTFKRTMKTYDKEFQDPYIQIIDDYEFFESTKDPVVLNIIKAHVRLHECKTLFILNYGIEENEDSGNEAIKEEAMRYEPYKLMYKRSKSYKKLKLYYERALVENIDYFYTYACALTASSYKIPLVLKRQFALPEPESMRLLNQDDHNIVLLKELITGLKKDLEDFRLLPVNKKAKSNNTSKV